MVKYVLLLYLHLWPQSRLLKLFIATVLRVLLPAFGLSVPASFGVVEDVSFGLNDELLLFEIHLQNSLDQHERDAALWGRGGRHRVS